MKVWSAISEVFREYYETCGAFAVDEDAGKSDALFANVLDRATRDRHFRTKLLEFPVETLKKEGFDLPKGFAVHFVEDTDDTVHLPIPPFVGEVPEEAS